MAMLHPVPVTTQSHHYARFHNNPQKRHRSNLIETIQRTVHTARATQGKYAHCKLSNILGKIHCSKHNVVHLIAHKTQGVASVVNEPVATDQSAAHSASKFDLKRAKCTECQQVRPQESQVSGHSDETLRGVLDPGGTKSEFRNDIWSCSLIASETSCSTWLSKRNASVVWWNTVKERERELMR